MMNIFYVSYNLIMAYIVPSNKEMMQNEQNGERRGEKMGVFLWKYS